ncbi:MAG TPA: efflux RND transporter periplasmic adaptor subunit, partial [Ferruginibacter sp.]|nr:efflux RND transporter periplasmic adaptor subunit [Ferruginibacter sp.]
MNIKNYLRFAFFMLLVIPACKSNTEAHEEHEPKKQHSETPDKPGSTSLTLEQMQAIGVEIGQIENKELTTSLKANGTLRVPNQNKASVNSVYSGVIKSLLVQPGSKVSKGQTLATIGNPEFIQAQSDYLGVSAKIQLAELEVKRQKELNAGNAGSLKNLQSAESELKTLRNLRSTLAQQIQLMGINPSGIGKGKLISVLAVKSPISGIVSNVPVKMGSYVDISTVVADIVDNSQLHLDLSVYEKDLPQLKDNQTIHFTLTNNPGKEYDAQIFSLGSSFEGESKAIAVHAKVLGDKTGLIDGMNVTAIISLAKAHVPAIPSEAIVNTNGQDFIFRVVPHQKEEEKNINNKAAKQEEALHHNEDSSLAFEMVPVVKGTTEVGYTQITLLKEIPNNAKVV